MKFGIKILPRDVLLDTQGRAVQSHLVNSNWPITDCRVGKYIVLEVAGQSLEDAKKTVNSVVTSTLVNPLIETYTVEQL